MSTMIITFFVAGQITAGIKSSTLKQKKGGVNIFRQKENGINLGEARRKCESNLCLSEIHTKKSSAYREPHKLAR